MPPTGLGEDPTLHLLTTVLYCVPPSTEPVPGFSYLRAPCDFTCSFCEWIYRSVSILPPSLLWPTWDNSRVSDVLLQSSHWYLLSGSLHVKDKHFLKKNATTPLLLIKTSGGLGTSKQNCQTSWQWLIEACVFIYLLVNYICCIVNTDGKLCNLSPIFFNGLAHKKRSVMVRPSWNDNLEIKLP